jgi:hypothetical protein
MNSLFSCAPTKPRTLDCVLAELSPCSDKVSHLICNGQSRLFGLTHKQHDCAGGDNYRQTATDTNLELPLFMDAEGVVLINVISNFAKSVAKKNPHIKDQKFASLISCMVGVNAIGNS